MKKQIALLLAIFMIFALSACRSDNPAAGEPTAAAANTSSGTNADPNGDVTSEAGNGETVEETVLVDQEGLKITAVSLDTAALFGPELTLRMENNTDKTLVFQNNYVVVNGYMADAVFSCEVAAGEQAENVLTLMDTDLEASGVETITDLEISFHVVESGTWEAYYDSPLLPLKTSASGDYTQVYDDSGKVIFDKNDLKLVAKGIQDEGQLGQGLYIYIENNSDSTVTVSSNDVSVNGYIIDSIFSTDILPGKRAVQSILFLKNELETFDITRIYQVELSFRVFDAENWDMLYETDLVKLAF